MRSVVEPNAFVVWNAVKTVGTFAGIEEWQPKSDAEWMAVRNAAMTVAESGNLLMLAPRARDRDQWMRAAQALVDTGTAAIRAAEVRNAEQLLAAGGEMFSACSNCHQKYMAP